MITLLGPQQPESNLQAVLDRRGLQGPLAVVTAGWREREGELDELRDAVGHPVTDLALYARAEEVFEKKPALCAAHRARQRGLITLQRLYRLRLTHASAAAHALFALEGENSVLEAERNAAIAALRSLDRRHVRLLRRAQARFHADWDYRREPALQQHRRDIQRVLQDCVAVLIAGGHVAVLVNRLKLVGFGDLVRGKPLIAWSAGAMAVSERIVLFHDHPPLGPGPPEVLETGLGLVSGVIPLPHGNSRLALDDQIRVAMFARRFRPALCAILEPGSVLSRGAEREWRARGVRALSRRGRVEALS